MSDTCIKWADVRKEMYSPEELIEADRLIALHKLNDGVQTIRSTLADLQSVFHQAVLSGIPLDERIGSCLNGADAIFISVAQYIRESCPEPLPSPECLLDENTPH